MRLEDEIKQPHFRSQEHKLFVNILYTYNWLIAKTDLVFEKNGLTMQQYNILRILRGQHPGDATLSMIKDRILDKGPDVSRLVERLVIKGLVSRVADPKDRRKIKISINEKGLELLTTMDPESIKMDQFMSNLNEKEKKQLNLLLDQLRG